MSATPPPLPSSRHRLFLQLARFSWLSVILAFGANMVLRPPSLAAQPVVTIVVGSLCLLGIISGIVALFGILRYGRKGLLWPSVTGLGLWLLLFALALPVYWKVQKIAALRRQARALQPATHSPAATRVQDPTVGYSFDLPEGYVPFPELVKLNGLSHAFIQQVNRVLLVKPLGGTLARERLRPQDVPAGSAVSLVSFRWRGLEIDGFRIPENPNGIEYLTFNVQVPLRKRAVQLGFGGPAKDEADLRVLVEQVLSTLDGETNW